MATRKEFCDAMYEVYKNHGVYIGTGNGELTEGLTVGRIRQMEVNYGYDETQTNNNINRDFAFIGKCYKAGYDMSKSIAGDCSGIVVGVMRKLGIISKTADFNCRTFMANAKKVAIKDLKPGDLVFNKTSEPSHMGVYVGDDMVIESKGRDVGVVYRRTTEGGWVIGGRLDWFEDEPIPELTRNLKYVEGNLMRGEDVGMAQERLKLHGCDPGKIDGIFGKNTRDAVLKFQKEKGLVVDGIIGQKTWNALWAD